MCFQDLRGPRQPLGHHNLEYYTDTLADVLAVPQGILYLFTKRINRIQRWLTNRQALAYCGKQIVTHVIS